MANGIPKTGEIGWNRLMTDDIEKAKAFYQDVFGWETFEVDLEGAPYFIFKLGAKKIAGLMQLPQQWQAPPHWMSFIAVENIENTINEARRLGAELIIEPKIITGLGLVALFKDPTGAVAGLYQPF
ncbi:VOC family protein [Legionella londiniensis]|uniref:Glyoxalase/bleomycin resistance protein n=1 Tax=Legionella londiniensis TaxID=45068 RepID=A0A0W0VJU6_9GAMM|nr:VOC family protein [Legionella londiniensis]KTD20356.1 glyoxalase/bleomycin resistance protein [Legionella londiniensis]STX93959.1 glyoxalase/bleomycin resistance protein [Legionella londiniensis]